jgi:predicted nucleic acid-binding protein
MASRVVIDTNQVIAAGSSWLVRGRPIPDPNTSRRVLIRVAEAHKGLYCGKIIGEYLEKLIDFRHPHERVLKFVTYLMGAFEQVIVTMKTAPHSPKDPDDEIFILCALDGDADYLISEDASLLDLKPHYSRPCIGSCRDVVDSLGA